MLLKSSIRQFPSTPFASCIHNRLYRTHAVDKALHSIGYFEYAMYGDHGQRIIDSEKKAPQPKLSASQRENRFKDSKEQVCSVPMYSLGRSIHGGVRGNPFAALNRVLAESNVRQQVMSQRFFESNHDKKRRKRKQQEWRAYMRHSKTQIGLAWDNKLRSKIEQKTYRELYSDEDFGLEENK
ncbi:hypothetical protein HK098_007694 [Nowakowskiella sp. JEL0407]|nr:hypothetical protein HK098_007694 [Nowakowskiella sp. JEL0407]